MDHEREWTADDEREVAAIIVRFLKGYRVRELGCRPGIHERTPRHGREHSGRKGVRGCIRSETSGMSRYPCLQPQYGGHVDIQTGHEIAAAIAERGDATRN